MKNVPVLPIEVNYNITLIKVYQVAKNELMIYSDIVLIRPNYIEEYIKTINYNIIRKGKSIQDEIRQLARLCKETGNDIYILLYKEFRDRFYSCTTKNLNEGILLYMLPL